VRRASKDGNNWIWVTDSYATEVFAFANDVHVMLSWNAILSDQFEQGLPQGIINHITCFLATN
jgi:hypothetical protein